LYLKIYIDRGLAPSVSGSRRGLGFPVRPIQTTTMRKKTEVFLEAEPPEVRLGHWEGEKKKFFLLIPFPEFRSASTVWRHSALWDNADRPKLCLFPVD